MDTVICPNCGHEISVPKKKVSSIKCPKCNMDGLELGLDYFDENDDPKKPFLKRHSKETAAAALFIAGLAGKAFLWWLDNRNTMQSVPVSESNSSDNTLAESSNEALAESTTSQLIPIDSEEATQRLIHYNLNKRRLPENQRASAAKREEANALGIDIGNEYTIVDPYDRPNRKKTST